MQNYVKVKAFNIIDLHDFMDVMEKLIPGFDRNDFWEGIPFSFGDLDVALVGVHRLVKKMCSDEKILNLIAKNFSKDDYINLEG